MAKGTAGRVHEFGRVPGIDIPRSTFNRSHRHLTTIDADYLYPVLVDDIVPGDSFNVKAHLFGRLATPLFPIMDNIYMDIFFFFVPYRLVWDNWEKFCGAQDDPADSISFTIPAQSSGTTVDVRSGLDGGLRTYMGLPPNSSVDLSEISALPVRGYNLIWNEWYRDQNLQDSAEVETDDGPDTYASYVLRKRGKRADYFTSCLPWPQKQTSSVELPMGTYAPIAVGGTTGDGQQMSIWSDQDADENLMDIVGSHLTLDTSGASGTAEIMYADLDHSTAVGSNINDFRLAFQTQRLLERDARSGTRYVETVLAHFGVTVPDYRAQRPEYLGGGSTPINITPVAQTTYQGTPTDEDTKGALAGFGTVSGSHGFTKSFVEHGVLIGLVNVRADITYSQGIERYWHKDTRYDFYYPVLAQIGEQAVLNQEIWYQNAAADDQVFGYQERYAEMRYKPSRLSGQMAVDHASTLSAWHLSEDFGSLPSLDSTFIESNTGTPLDRAIAVSSEPQFILDIYFEMQCARPMPLFGVPGNLDRF